jgi:AcrR family transcriptional regulator
VTAVPADPRTARTQAKLHRALLEECTHSSLAEVSVTAVVRRAGVGRATFYLHYGDLEALAVDACADIVREAVEALHAWRGTPNPGMPPPALLAFFDSIASQAGPYRELLSPGGSGPLGHVLHRDLRARSHTERTLAGAPAPDLFASAVAATFVGVLADWLHGLIEATPAQIAQWIWRLLVHLHRTPLS